MLSGIRREDRVAEEVLLRREAVEVPGAVRRPARADEQRDDRQVVEEDPLQLRGDLLLLRRVQRPLPLVRAASSPWRRRSAPSCRSSHRSDPAGRTRSGRGSSRSTRTASPATRPARAASGTSSRTRSGCQAPQSGSSATWESIPMSRRFLVMIWFEATQSDQPAMTWMSSLTAVAVRVDQPAAVVREAGVGQDLLGGRRGCSWTSSWRRALTFLSVTHFGKSPFRPIASVGGA